MVTAATKSVFVPLKEKRVYPYLWPNNQLKQSNEAQREQAALHKKTSGA